MPYSEATFNRKKSILVGANRYSAYLLLETLRDIEDALQDEVLAPQVLSFLTQDFAVALSSTRVHVAEQIDLHRDSSVKTYYLELLTRLLGEGKITEEAYYTSIAYLSILTDEQQLLCIQHGINHIKNFCLNDFFNLINQKISVGNQALVTEILNPETALSKLVKGQLKNLACDLLLETLRDIEDALQDEVLAPQVLSFLTQDFVVALSSTRVHVAEQIDLHRDSSVKTYYLELLTRLLGEGKITEEAYYTSIAYLSILTDEQKLLCIRHGINHVQNFCLNAFFNLINQKISSGDQALITEILDPETALSKFVKGQLRNLVFANIRLFISFILTLSEGALRQEGDLKFFTLFDFLKTKIDLGFDRSCQPAHLIGEGGSEAELLCFIELLRKIAEHQPQALLDYLKLRPQYKNGTLDPRLFQLTILHNFSQGLDASPLPQERATEKYIALLDYILEKKAETLPEIQALLATPSSTNHTGFSVTLQQQLPHRPDLLLRLMLKQFIVPAELEQLKSIKHELAQTLIQHSHRLEKTEAVAVLSDALNPESYLGAYFYLQRGHRPCSLEHGTLSILLTELRAQDPEAAARIVEAHRPATESSMIADTHTSSRFFRLFHRRERSDSVDKSPQGLPKSNETGIELALLSPKNP